MLSLTTYEEDFGDVALRDLLLRPVAGFNREREFAVSELITLRHYWRLPVGKVAERMRIGRRRVIDIERHPSQASWKKICAYARALSRDYNLFCPRYVDSRVVDALLVRTTDFKTLRKKIRALLDDPVPREYDWSDFIE